MKTELSKQQEDMFHDAILKDKPLQLTGRQILTSIYSKENTKQNKQQKVVPDNSQYNNKRTKRELNALITIKENEISSLSHTQEKYQCELQSLLQKLNGIVTVATSQMNNGANAPNQNSQKQLEYLESLRSIRIKDFQKAKSQNKIYKDQYDLYQTKANGISNDKLNELETKIDALVEDNQSLNKKIRDSKNKQNVKSKVLEGYSSNVKYPREIKAYTEEIKSLSSKKHDYYNKLNVNRKALSNCLLQMTKIEELYSKLKMMTNLPNPIPIGKIDHEINRINTDLKGSEDDIIQRIDNDEMIIIQEDNKKQQMIASGNSNNHLPHPHPRYLKSIPLNKIKKNPHTSHSANRRIIISNKDNNNRNKRLSPQSIQVFIPSTLNKRGTYSHMNPNFNHNHNYNSGYNTNNNNDIGDINNLEDKDFSNITYETLTDFEYKELKTKKEHYSDIIIKIENSIKEAKKMYERKLKEMSNTLDQSSKKLSYIEQENELLKSEIADLSKINKLNEEANQMKRDNQKTFKTVQKEPIVHTINNDVSETRNDILNDLNVLDNSNEKNINHNKYPTSILEENDQLEDKEDGSKIKFPDISNVEHIDEEKSTINRDRILMDIKKKYIKLQSKKVEEVEYMEPNEEEGVNHDENKQEVDINCVKEKEEQQNILPNSQNKEEKVDRDEQVISIKEHSLKDRKMEDDKQLVNDPHDDNNDDDDDLKDNEKGDLIEDKNNKLQDEVLIEKAEKEQLVCLETTEVNQNKDDTIIKLTEEKTTVCPQNNIIRIEQREGKMPNVWDDIDTTSIKNNLPSLDNDELKSSNQVEKIQKVEDLSIKNDNNKEQIIENKEMQAEIKDDLNMNNKRNEELNLQNKDSDIVDNNDIKNENNIKEVNDLNDSIENNEIGICVNKEKEEEKKEEENKMKEQENQIDNLRFDDENDNKEDGDNINSNKDYLNQEPSNQGKEAEAEENNNDEEEENQDENEEEDKQEDQERDQDDNQEQDDQEQNNNEETYKNNNLNESPNKGNNPLSDSLEKSPQKEANTILTKLQKENLLHK